MAKGDRYLKVVVWPDEDKCFIGTCPQLMYGRSYGDDAQQVFAELCELVEEAIETLEEAGKPLPQPLSLQERRKRVAAECVRANHECGKALFCLFPAPSTIDRMQL